jgi:hypothetical protein
VKSRSVAIIALTAMTASGCGVSLHFTDHRYTKTLADTTVAGPVTDVRVNAGGGHVVVTTGGDGGVSVHRVVHYQSGTPHPGQQLSDGTLTFTTGCSRCDVDYDLVVPASARMWIRTDSGQINVTGVAGADLDTDSGTMSVRHVKGAVTTHSDSGTLTVDDLGGDFTAATDSASVHGTALRSATVAASSDSGTISLGFTAAPTSVRMKSDSGSLNLKVPGGPYAIDVHTDSGGQDIKVPNDSAARSRLNLRTDSGSVNVDPVA